MHIEEIKKFFKENSIKISKNQLQLFCSLDWNSVQAYYDIPSTLDAVVKRFGLRDKTYLTIAHKLGLFAKRSKRVQTEAGNARFKESIKKAFIRRGYTQVKKKKQKKKIDGRCPFCNKYYRQLAHHAPYCKHNPNRKHGKNQITKCREQGKEYIVSLSTRQKISKSLLGKKMSKARRIQLSKSMQRAVRQHKESYTGAFAYKSILYNNEKYNSKWEILFAQYLEAYNIEYNRTFNERFEYSYKKKNRIYVPDFYLPKYNCFIEIKGNITTRDIAKWRHFPNNQYSLYIFSGKLMSNIAYSKIKDNRILEKLNNANKHQIFFNYTQVIFKSNNTICKNKLLKLNKEL